MIHLAAVFFSIALLVLLVSFLLAGARGYSQFLRGMNLALLPLLAALLLLRYLYEGGLLFHTHLDWAVKSEFLLAPVYGAFLLAHLFFNRHFFTVQWKAFLGLGQNRSLVLPIFLELSAKIGRKIKNKLLRYL